MRVLKIIPASVSLVAVVIAFLSILAAIEGLKTGGQYSVYFRLSALLIILTMVFDGLDGNLARYLRTESTFGAELDTFVDMIAYGISPAVLLYVTTVHLDLFRHIIVPLAVVMFGVVRLSRFKTKDHSQRSAEFTGLPINVNSTWIAVFIYIGQTLNYDLLSIKALSIFFYTSVIGLIILQVSKIPYPKPTKNNVFLGLAILFMACLACFAFIKPLEIYSIYAAFAFILTGVWYVFVSPLSNIFGSNAIRN